MPVGETAHVTGPSRTNLLRLWLIRTILLMALIGGLTALRNFTEYELPWTALWTVLLAMALVNVALLYRLWLPRPVGEVNRELLSEHGILGGYDLGKDDPMRQGHMLVAVTEMNDPRSIDRFVDAVTACCS